MNRLGILYLSRLRMRVILFAFIAKHMSLEIWKNDSNNESFKLIRLGRFGLVGSRIN